MSHIYLCAESEGFNIDSFSMSKDHTWNPPTYRFPSEVSVVDAFDNVPAIIPGTIQAEEFDTGGEGVGYSDSTKGNEKGVSGRG